MHASTAQSRVGSLDASGLRIGVVVARFNELVTKLLLEGALDAFSRHGGADSEVSHANSWPMCDAILVPRCYRTMGNNVRHKSLPIKG